MFGLWTVDRVTVQTMEAPETPLGATTVPLVSIIFCNTLCLLTYWRSRLLHLAVSEGDLREIAAEIRALLESMTIPAGGLTCEQTDH